MCVCVCVCVCLSGVFRIAPPYDPCRSLEANRGFWQLGWGPNPSFFLLFFILFSDFFSTSPIRASIACVGMDGFGLYSDPPFLRSVLLVFLLGIVVCSPRGSGIR